MDTRSKKLNPNVWEKLPIHLLERIVMFLPIPTQTRICVVNKHFNNWLSSRELDVLSEELPLKKFVVLWYATQVIGPAPSDMMEYTCRGGFGNLQRRSKIFNADCLRPFMTNLSMWDIDILVTRRCFVCISCKAKEDARQHYEKVEKNNERVVRLFILNLMNNDVHEIPSDMALHLNDSSYTNNRRMVSIHYDIAVHENDRDFRFINVLATADGVTVMELYDSTTNRRMKFDDIFQGVEYGRMIYHTSWNLFMGSCCTTFDQMYMLNIKMETQRICLTSFSYNLTDHKDGGRIDIDIELPKCFQERFSDEIELITTDNRVFILGLTNTTHTLCHVDLARMACVECNKFKIFSELAPQISFVGAYSDYLVFGPDMEFWPPDFFDMINIPSFKVYDLKRQEWRDLTRIKDKSISKPTSGYLDDLHLEYFYDPYVEFN